MTNTEWLIAWGGWSLFVIAFIWGYIKHRQARHFRMLLEGELDGR